jgi:hypothetical protein
VKFLVAPLLAGVVGLPLTGAAQVAPPPPPAAPAPAKLVPPPPRPPRRPMAPVQKPAGKPRPKAPPAIQVPDLPYEPLARFDENGKLIRIEGSVDMAALKHNPTVGPATIERVRPFLTDWQQRVDVMVVDNLDIMQDVDNGLFENIDLADENQKVLMNEVFKMIISTSNPNNVMASSGALSKTQMDFQRKLVADYTTALDREVASEISAKIPGDDKEAKQKQLLEGSRFSLENMSRDEVRAYHRLLVTAAGLAEQVLPGLGLSAEEQQKAAAPLAAVRAAQSDGEKLQAVKSLLATMELMRQRDFMKAVLDARGPATLPELDDAAVKPNGLPPVEDIDEPKPEEAPAGDSSNATPGEPKGESQGEPQSEPK